MFLIPCIRKLFTKPLTKLLSKLTVGFCQYIQAFVHPATTFETFGVSV